MVSAVVKLVIATSNRGKLEEFRALLGHLPIELVGTSDVLSRVPTIDEDALTFAGNALKKATIIAHAAGGPTLADDSGLEVDALGGRPGVRSARFAHEHATDAENNAALLAALQGVAPAQRSARFRCALALVDPRTGDVATAEGTCEGRIATAPRGAHGFGYDPLFMATGDTQTLAELSAAHKNQLSHRARAIARLTPMLEAWLHRTDAARAEHEPDGR